jgi:hypothetical protein
MRKPRLWGVVGREEAGREEIGEDTLERFGGNLFLDYFD